MAQQPLTSKQRAEIKFRGIPMSFSCGHPECNRAYPTHDCKEGERASSTPGFKTIFFYTCPKGHEVFGVELE
jgi:hypothetical protein